MFYRFSRIAQVNQLASHIDHVMKEKNYKDALFAFQIQPADYKGRSVNIYEEKPESGSKKAKTCLVAAWNEKKRYMPYCPQTGDYKLRFQNTCF